MAVLVERDSTLLEPLLMHDRIGNLALAAELSSAAPGKMRVLIDRRESPGGVVVLGDRNRLYARDARALQRLMPALIDFVDRLSDEVMFAGVAGWACAQIARRRELAWESPCWLYYLERSSFVPLSHSLDVRPLEPRHAELVARHWELGGDNASEYLRMRIENGSSAAVYVDGEPVSWSLTHHDGQMGTMFTLPDERRKGYARAVTYSLVGKLLELGRTPFLYVKQENVAGQRAAESMGFARWGDYRWFGLR